MMFNRHARRALGAALAFSIGATFGAVAQTSAQPKQDEVVAYRVGKVVTMDDDDRVVNNAVVLVRNGKIETVGKAKNVEIPDGATVHEYPDLWLVPGLVEAHNHIGGSMGDLHDYVYLTNPGLGTKYAIEPNNDNAKRGLAGGVTTALLIPGSGTNMSGFGTLMKLGGDKLEDVIIKYPGSIKIAQAGNPERYWYRVGRAMMNYNTRNTVQHALDYHLAWEKFEKGETGVMPPFDPTYEGFRGLFRHEFIASVHTQAYQVVLNTIDMLGYKFGVKTMLDHSTFDGYKTAPLITEHGDIRTVVGPRALYFDRTQRRVFGIAARYSEAGVDEVGINTDSPVIPQEELSYQATMAAWYGWNRYDALKAVTRATANSMMIGEQVGAIAPGYDADFGLWTGDPIDPRSSCRFTIVDGNLVHNGEKDSRF